MKLVCISASQVPSTAANSIQVMKVCQALAQIGHDVHLLVPRSVLRVEPWALKSYYGVAMDFLVEWLPANRRFRRYDFCWAAVRRARALEADAVYAWPLQAAVFAALRGIPVLMELHEPPQGRLAPFLFRRFLRIPVLKRLLPISQALANIIARIYHGLPSTIISPDAVDLERYQNLPDPVAARRQLEFHEMFTAGYTGNLYAGRGMNLLVELAHRYPQAQFLWVGGRPEEVETWREQLAAQGIGNVVLTGFVENSCLPLYQAAADVLLMPYERVITGSSGGNTADFCSPMKMFEYMACGRAIISSDLPVLREVLNEDNAMLCPPENTEAWAQAFDALWTNVGQREMLGHQARLDVQGYTWIERARKALKGFSSE